MDGRHVHVRVRLGQRRGRAGRAGDLPPRVAPAAVGRPVSPSSRRSGSVEVVVARRQAADAGYAPHPGAGLPVVHAGLLHQQRRQSNQEVAGQRLRERLVHPAQLDQARLGLRPLPYLDPRLLQLLEQPRIRDAVEMNSPTQTTKPLPKLPENIVSALEKARDDKTLIDGSKHVGHLRRDDFTTLRDWCRAMRLGSDAAAVEAAVTAMPE